MDFETARVSAKPERKHRATVHTSTARRSASASVSASTSAYNGSGGDHHGGGGGHSYTHQTRWEWQHGVIPTHHFLLGPAEAAAPARVRPMGEHWSN